MSTPPPRPQVQTIAPIRVASLLRTIDTFRAQGAMWTDLLAFLKQHNIQAIGPRQAIVHSCDAPDIVVEVCVPIAENVEMPVNNQGVRAYMLEGVKAVVGELVGPMQDVSQVHEAVARWAREHKFAVTGPVREVYKRIPMGEEGAEDVGWDLVEVEVQLPI
ncbi:hypothetical protein BJ741DRAFT_603625 [Chytriomyces cf. hyalinus JEL632]|nr:hypothetical protein BJ741DRAFT_603625 [Chytriomyces cf. hyalinus JEL632]